MKKLIAATVAVLSLTAMQAMAGSPVHIWKCQMNDEMGEEELLEYSKEWQKAASKVKGGKEMKSQIYFPVAAAADGTGTDLLYISSWPDFTAYGKFWDAYPESDAAAMEGEAMTCHGSALWEAMN
jgi:hypothetical protein